MIEAIAKEISAFTIGEGNTDLIETIYIGGGTPSLLFAAELEQILTAVHSRFSIVKNAEVTLEANPDDIDLQKLEEWITLGVNRLSLGLQTFDENELRWMNRAHNAAQAAQSIQLIRQSGMANYSVDLIYGSPLQSHDQLRENLSHLIRENVPHISAYALTVEPKTALAKAIATGDTQQVDDLHQSEQFQILTNTLMAAGYEQYEISNFARPGSRSKHNSSYWQGKPYYGFGPSAHSYDGMNTRRWNVSNNAKYLAQMAAGEIFYEEEILSETQALNEYIMISLRTMEGLSLQHVRQKYNADLATTVVHNAEKYLQEKRLILTQDHLILTAEGKFFADGIAADLFFI